jgi:hypothetical protein
MLIAAGISLKKSQATRKVSGPIKSKDADALATGNLLSA